MTQIPALLVMAVTVLAMVAEVRSLAEINAKRYRQGAGDLSLRHRSKRSSAVHYESQTDIDTILHVHNKLRRAQHGSNMFEMTWHPVLAKMAADYVQYCIFLHHQITSETPPYPEIGQNLYSSLSSMNLTSALGKWAEEGDEYNITSATCDSGHVCGHYTAMVWHNTVTVGCAYTHCDTIHNASSVLSGTYLICNYGPIGNFLKLPAYTEGPECSACEDGGQCRNGLCTLDCKDKECECKLLCGEGSVLNKESCICECDVGWMGTKCDEPCRDLSSNCYINFPTWFCNWEPAKQDTMDACPKMCGLCKVHSDTTTTKQPTTTTTTTTTTKQPTTTTTTITTTQIPTPKNSVIEVVTPDVVMTFEEQKCALLYNDTEYGCRPGGYAITKPDTATLDPGTCKCNCYRPYAGDMCKRYRRNGLGNIPLGIISVWKLVYALQNDTSYQSKFEYMRMRAMKYINKVCKYDVRRCCIGASTEIMEEYEFSMIEDIQFKIFENRPNNYGKEITTVLFYTDGSPGGEFCNHATYDTFVFNP